MLWIICNVFCLSFSTCRQEGRLNRNRKEKLLSLVSVLSLTGACVRVNLHSLQLLDGSDVLLSLLVQLSTMFLVLTMLQWYSTLLLLFLELYTHIPLITHTREDSTHDAGIHAKLTACWSTNSINESLNQSKDFYVAYVAELLLGPQQTVSWCPASSPIKSYQQGLSLKVSSRKPPGFWERGMGQ